MAVALLFSVGPVLAPALAYGLALRGLGIPGGLFAGAVVLGAIALGQAAAWSARGHGALLLRHQLGGAQPGRLAEADAAAFSALTHLGTVHQPGRPGRHLRAPAQAAPEGPAARAAAWRREAAHHVAHEAVEPVTP